MTIPFLSRFLLNTHLLPTVCLSFSKSSNIHFPIFLSVPISVFIAFFHSSASVLFSASSTVFGSSVFEEINEYSIISSNDFSKARFVLSWGLFLAFDDSVALVISEVVETDGCDGDGIFQGDGSLAKGFPNFL